MKVALLGSTGMLGVKVAEVFRSRGHEIIAPSHSEVDLSRPYSLDKFFKTREFDLLINAAGFTRVDACEESARFYSAWNANATAAGWLAKLCKRTNRILVGFSTDYVFDGAKPSPYMEEDSPAPLNNYGRTKAQAEKLVLAENHPFYLIRASWFFGPGKENFVSRIAELMRTRPRLEVVRDQQGGPTYTGDLAQFTLELLEKKAEPGFYHFCNEGFTSWYGFAQEIQRQMGLQSCTLVPVLSASIFRPAQRPANSRLDTSKAVRTLGHPIRPWTEALQEYITKEYRNEPA